MGLQWSTLAGLWGYCSARSRPQAPLARLCSEMEIDLIEEFEIEACDRNMEPPQAHLLQ